MFRFHRADAPEGFEARVAIARKAIADRVDAGQCLDDEHFPDLWSEYKRHFWRVQFGKCGYCECKLREPGDVEHYRPKKAIQALPDNPDLWGKEIDDGTNVEGRRPTWISPWGYHWLTYAWSNYLLACERCNRAWKRNLFPIAETERSVPPDPGVPETPLLLNPFEGEEPTAHLAFDRYGQIRPRNGSLHGWETIRTCGLDQESLRDRRADKARVAFQLIRELARTTGEEKRIARAKLHDMGRPSSEFAGMVRSIFETETCCRWRDMFEDMSG
ncbi:MAG: hypothetical protein QM820_38940 [Minicystis sp.]